ncbi:hypothetical protein ACF91D_29905, partial [Staphylococcus sp. 231237_7MaSpsaltlick]|uniref:hypothetical protein n=1 Tax=Staphylococcus sp. 231237_7MaSpsaltlick TaxID=3367518 RepID=UPI00370BE84B
MTMLQSIDRWLRPYRYHFEDDKMIEFKEQQKRKKQKLKKSIKYKLNEEEEKETKAFLKRGGIGVELTTLNNKLDKHGALNMLHRSNYNIG